MKKLALASALVLAATAAQAYQFEVQGQVEHIDNTVNDQDYSGSVQGTYYFKDVDATKGPLAEAAFLNQASNVSAAYSFGQYQEPGFKANVQTAGIQGEAYVTTEYVPVPVYASANYSHTTIDGKNGATDDKGERYGVELGAVVIPNFLVAVGYTNVAAHTSFDAFTVANQGVAKAGFETSVNGDDQDAWTARTKYVGAIDGTAMSIGFGTDVLFADYKAYGANVDLFVNNQLSIGTSYAETRGAANSNPKVWGVNANYFITPAIAVGANYVNANAVGDVNDTETVALNAKFRF
jgi:hypothetical protein